MRFPTAPFWTTLPLATLGSFFLFNSIPESPSETEIQPRVPENRVNRSAFLEEEVIISPEEMDSDIAIRSAVEWLLRHQFTDGMWSPGSFSQMCPERICGGSGKDSFDLAMTALGLWALLDSGIAHETRVWDAAREAVAWLKEKQDREDPNSMYGQAIATIAFCRAFQVLGDSYAMAYAERGLRWMEQAQNRDGGWGYQPVDGRSDSSVTAWVSQSILLAEKIGMEVSPRAKSGALEWFEGVTDPHYYRVSYRDRGKGGSVLRGRNEQYERNGSLTALATVVRFSWGMDHDDPRIREAVRSFSWNLPVWNRSRSSVDFTYWYGGTMAMAAAGEDLRKLWRIRIRRLLGRYQEVRGCRAGSWNPEDKWGCEGGRVYATALNILTLVRATE